MEILKTDNKMFGYHICPRYNRVYAEIYYTTSTNNIEIQVINKEFGSFWRNPNESDYIKAKEWVLNQLKYIQNAHL